MLRSCAKIGRMRRRKLLKVATFELFTVELKIQNEFSWVVTSCSDVVGCQRFGGPCLLKIRGVWPWISETVNNEFDLTCAPSLHHGRNGRFVSLQWLSRIYISSSPFQGGHALLPSSALFPGVKNCWKEKLPTLPTLLHLVPIWRIRGAVPPLISNYFTLHLVLSSWSTVTRLHVSQ
jgi:hypothetical protein